FGPSLINTILKYTPEWLTGGLTVAGEKIQPVVNESLLKYINNNP
ncbi:PTS sugar transporter subunit IIC, partial [Clostridioides difficile]|nr:PTS sugar transporter subunit IIC [Clostridioides difficile]